MGRAVGIGGVFLHFKGDLEAVLKWYEEELGLDMTEYGTGFITGEQLCLISFKRGSDDDNTPYLNFRVVGIEELILNFKNKGLLILMDVEDFSYGKFARIVDPFGNVIELWEPIEDEYRKMVAKEIKDYKNRNR